MSSRPSNPWKGALLGVAGGFVGLLAMRVYQQHIAPALSERFGPSDDEADADDEKGALESISLIGTHHREDESSTAALGRILYESFTGEEPDDETKAALSYLVHWGYGLVQGGVYGALSETTDTPPLEDGLAFGTSLWLVGDEIVVPLLGLQDGPSAAPPVQHFNRLGAHLAYGITTAAATRLLRRTFKEESAANDR